jgi:recombination protein RecA
MPKKKKEKEKDYTKMSLEEALASVNKRYGAGKIMRASSARALSVPRLETGVFAVDYATSGGLPIGRVSGIYGKKSSGKTLLALKTVASAQRYCRKHLVKMLPTKKKLYRCLECGLRGEKEGVLCSDCKEAGYESKLIDMGDCELKCPVCKEYNPFETVWMDAEGSWENHWAQQMGVNCHYVYMIRTEFAEQAIDISDILIRNQKCDLLVIDTIAHLIPLVEIQESSEKWQMGYQARLVNKMLRKIVSAQNSPSLSVDNRATVILLNQVRVKLGVMFGDPETRPGGMGQDFVTAVDIKMRAGKYEQDEDKNTLNLLTNFRVVKNKVGPPQQEGNFRVWLRDYEGHTTGDVEDRNVVIGQAFKHGWFGEFDPDKPKTPPVGGWGYSENKFKTNDDLYRFFQENPDVYEDLRTSLFSEMLGSILSDEDSIDAEVDDDDDDDSDDDGEVVAAEEKVSAGEKE